MTALSSSTSMSASVICFCLRFSMMSASELLISSEWQMEWDEPYTPVTVSRDTLSMDLRALTSDW